MPDLSESNPQAKQIDALRPSVEGIILPPLPYTPMPGDVVERNPALQGWYDMWYAEMDRWRTQVNFVLSTTQSALSNTSS